jgi:hypothetical protein
MTKNEKHDRPPPPPPPPPPSGPPPLEEEDEEQERSLIESAMTQDGVSLHVLLSVSIRK